MSEAEKKESLGEIITLKNERVKVQINPEGAFIERLVVDGQDVLYPRTIANPKRGGIPVLGPTPGPTRGTEWGYLYAEERMPAHGNDRRVAWTVADEDDRRVILRRFIGPREFHFAGSKEYGVTLLESGIQIATTITNLTGNPKEIGHALHPYFDAEKGFTMEKDGLKQDFPLEPGKSVMKEGRGLGTVNFLLNGNRFVMVNDPEPVNMVLWSDKPEEYVCVEPWYAGRGKGVVVSGESSVKFSTTIQKVT